jgi:hypothetical protein
MCSGNENSIPDIHADAPLFHLKIRASLTQFTNTFESLVTDPVRTDTSVPYAQSQGLTVFEYAERQKIKSRAAEDFARLAHDLREGV